MSQDLKGKIALVTGASRGIGRAIAERLAKDGAVVAVHYGRSKDSAEATVAAIKAAGGDAFAIGAELTEKGAVAKLFAALDAELVKRTGNNNFDILVNNAGIAPFVSFEDTTEQHLDDIFAVNVKALYLITQEAAKRLNDGGRVISTSSVVARMPFPAVPAYSMLKAPVDNLTKTLAVAFGSRNITVNAVAPGVIDTDMAEFVRSEDGQTLALSMQALKRVGKPDDVADVVGFLAGPAARWVTGEIIEVGGGNGLTL